MLGFRKGNRPRSMLITLILETAIGPVAIAGPKEQASRIYNRLTGVPPTAVVLQEMTELITQGKPKEAAILAMEDPNFLNITVFDMFASFTNEDESNRVGLSDYLATVVGLVRDDADFKDVLTADVIYTPPLVTAAIPAWSTDNNLMYSSFAKASANFSAELVKKTQTEVIGPGLVATNPLAAGFSDFAGVLTTREFAVGYYIDGTNRAAFRFINKTFLCHDLDQLMDTTRPDYRIRQDVSRQPGDNSTVFRNKCAGCHTGMDPLAGAFAYMDATEVTDAVTKKLVTRYSVTPGVVQKKYFLSAENFPDGFVTKDDGWINLWVEGPNKSLGWSGPSSGKGIKSFGQLYANSEAFSQCMAKRAYARSCVQDALSQEGPHIDALAQSFKAGGYKMKNLFAEAMITCMGK